MSCAFELRMEHKGDTLESYDLRTGELRHVVDVEVTRFVRCRSLNWPRCLLGCHLCGWRGCLRCGLQLVSLSCSGAAITALSVQPPPLILCHGCSGRGASDRDEPAGGVAAPVLPHAAPRGPAPAQHEHRARAAKMGRR